MDLEGETMCEAIAATTAATAARLDRPNGLEDHLRQMRSLGEFMDAEMSFSDDDKLLMISDYRTQLLLQRCLKKLTSRDDLRFYFHHNHAIKQSVLSAVAALFKHHTNSLSKLEALQLLDELIGAEIDISRARHWLDESARSIYNSFYASILNDIETIINGFSILVPVTTKHESFMNHLCYMLVCMPSDYQTLCNNAPLLFKVIDFMLELKTCPHLASKALLSIAVHICDVAGDVKTAEIESGVNMGLACDLIKMELYEKCSTRCIELMSQNMRDKECRVSLKKALEIYCTHLPARLSQMMETDDYELADKLDGRMNQLLYHIVISIVRVLRAEFENHDESIEIELVIYFYEIIKQNLDNLTEDDAYDLAKKLMDILTKIEDWSERYQTGFTPHQLAYLNDLSFELVIKFIHILRQDFCIIHWQIFKKKWTKSILNWEPLAYKSINILCHYTDLVNFDYIRKLTRRVRNSWLGNHSNNNTKICKSWIKSNNEFNKFLDTEILSCVEKLISMYDKGIHNQLWYLEAFRTDLQPVLDILGHLFSSIESKEKMLKCARFYLFFSNLISPHLRNQELWSPHIELVIYHIVQITNQMTRFDMDEQLLEAVVKIAKVLLDAFDITKDYKHVMADLVSFADRQSRRYMLGPETKRDLKQISLLLDQ